MLCLLGVHTLLHTIKRANKRLDLIPLLSEHLNGFSLIVFPSLLKFHNLSLKLGNHSIPFLHNFIAFLTLINFLL